MNIPEEDQIKSIIGECRATGFAKWFGKKENYSGQPSSYITINVIDLLKYVAANGFDEATVSYRPLEARYLIENENGQWCFSFHERGVRQGKRYFTSKEDTVNYAAKILIENAKCMLDAQFGSGSG